MKIRMFGLIAVVALMLSLVGASTASAALQDQLVDDTYEATPGEHVVVDVFANDVGANFNWNVMSTGDCGWDGGGVVTYDVPSTATSSDVYVCAISVAEFSMIPDFGTETLTITVGDPPDTEGPVVDITSPLDGDTVDTDTVTLSYTVSDNVDSSPSCSLPDGASVSLIEGPNTITVTCTDDAGNEGSDSVNVTYVPPVDPDTEAPVVDITSPTDGSSVTNDAVALTYTVTDNQDLSPECNYPSGPDVSLVSGSNTITVTCTDDSGNEGSDTVVVTYAPPPVEIFVSDATVTETDPAQGTVSANFQVTLSRSADTDITLHYGTFWIPFVSGQALPGSDYVMTFGNLVIPAGQTAGQISVTVKADNRREANEIFFLLSFSCDEGVVQEDHVAVGTIINDDT